MTAKLDFNRAWAETMRLWSANRELLIAIAGVFLLLPGLAFGLLVPQPETPPAETMEALVEALAAFYRANAPWLIGVSLFSSFGTLTLLVLLLDTGRPRVADALSAAVRLLIPYVLAALVSGLAIFVGSLFFVIPGIYLFIRLLLAGPAIAAENLNSPIAALGRAWQLSRGNVLRILMFVGIIGVIGAVIYLTSLAVLGVIMRLVLPEGLAGTMVTLIDALLSMVISLVLTCAYAAVYRQLAQPGGARPFG